MPYIEIDQSGKIEQFNRNTVVALSNDRKYSVLLPKTVKQDIFIQYKNTISDLKYKLFSISLFYCLRNFVDEERKTVICTEYTGKERVIKSELTRLLKLNHIVTDPKVITFNRVTKDSPAHKLALSVFREIRKPDIVLSTKQIEAVLR